MPAVLTATFTRLPIPGGDNNNYDTYVMQQIRRGSIGGNNIDVSNSGGSLNVELGFAGINDGVTEGAIQVTVAGSQTLAGSTAGVWHALEFSVSGTAATFYLTALAGETDESFMSLTMKGYYDAVKCGYYRIPSRRILSFVFVRVGNALGRIVNTENGVKGFKNIQMVDYSIAGDTKVTLTKYFATYIGEIGAWNMDSTDRKAIPQPIYPIISAQKWRGIDVYIFDDFGVSYKLMAYADPTSSGNPGNIQGGIVLYGANYVLFRVVGGYFDSAQFDDAIINRGIVVVEYET
jgi:hypothetical protein